MSLPSAQPEQANLLTALNSLPLALTILISILRWPSQRKLEPTKLKIRSTAKCKREERAITDHQ